MMKQLLLVVLLCAFTVTAQAQNFDSISVENVVAAPVAQPTPDGCGDDPRLVTDIISIMSSNEPVSPPVTVTPATYMELDADVLTRLAGQMLICPDNLVLKNGKPMKKIVADFELIWDKIRKAAIVNDFETVKKIMAGFVATPKTAQEIALLFARVDMEEKIYTALYKAAGLAVPREDTLCYLIDFYIALGGSSSEKATVVMSTHNITKEEKSEFKDDIKEVVFVEKVTHITDRLPYIGGKAKALGLAVIYK